MELQTICSIIQGLFAFTGILLNAFSLVVVLHTQTLHKQIYSCFIGLINIATVVYCFSLVMTFPGYMSDHKEAIVYVTNHMRFSGKIGKSLLLFHLWIADFIMQVYPLFFGCRLATALIRIVIFPRKRIERAGKYLSRATLGVLSMTVICVGTFGLTHWDASFNTSEYGTSNFTYNYLRYDVNITISSWIATIFLAYYQWSMFISIVLVFLFYFLMSFLLVPDTGAGDLQSIAKQIRTMRYMRIQAFITFLCLSPIGVFKFFGLNNPMAEKLLYTMQCFFVVIVPIHNWWIPYWHEALPENPPDVRYFCCPPEPAPIEIHIYEL
ncbi:unnamed protein product [Caenorhabditis angaria]|uniref:Uncharacterized protein n=1 Tax=Caenorhabditis angaria TaxID=860376 RepID=A0A9P1J141_9PELO|nr:unnamed protein product [Caenorhabditis angaria]